MPYESSEREPINTSDPEFRDNTWAHDREKLVTSEYRDGMKITEGEVVEGDHVGHRWLRVEGGPVFSGQDLGPVALGDTSISVDQLSFHHASIVLEQGAGTGKDEKGFTSIKAKAVVTSLPEAKHDEAVLRELSDGDEQKDEQGRTIARVRNTGDRKRIVERTSYDDEHGIQITTGLHTAGPEQGKMYETRRALRPETVATAPVPNYETPRGTVSSLRLTSMTTDLRPADAVRAQGDQARTEQVVWLEFQGDWNGA